ncbi:DUF887-domain-containing protein [Lindgomyces ingoldianus]|uniref:DUF887-domain-containing protein n=1 Tax=Lindgomyces ingoldianus TaxID=673940 RepID=A0ACB6Q9G6_9PLEO|nr:DUF887-domain-containing protein [Lindgomyces ingoldianus]KAF2463180.1 DUF887-domain-containing protein [Lindgomyces ingoldianus]
MRDPLPAPVFLITLTTPVAQKLGLTTLPNHIHELLLGYLWYHILLTFISPTLSKLLVPRTYASFSRRTRLNWDMHWVSMVQALFINSAALWVILSDKEREGMDWRGRLWGYTGAQGMVQGFAAGYFLWDLWVSVRFIDVAGVSAAVHAVGALSVTMIGFRPFGNYYGLSFVLYELSTPFLNIHWFCDKLGATGSRLQLYNGIALLVSFFMCRLVWGTYQSVLIYSDIWTALTVGDNQLRGEMMREMGMKGVDGGKCDGRGSDRREGGGVDVTGCGIGELPMWLVSVYLVGNTALSFLNFYWFAQMIKAVRKRFVPRDKQGESRKVKGKVVRETNGFVKKAQ